MGSTPSVEYGFWFTKCRKSQVYCERKIKRKKEGRGGRDREGEEGWQKERERGEKDNRSSIVFFLINDTLSSRSEPGR